MYPANVPAFYFSEGCEVAGPGGRRYIDYVAGLLSVTLGHQHPEVASAVGAALGRGYAWPTVHRIEEDVADTLRRLCGYPEGRVRFTTTGTHACEAAVRIARAVTGRYRVISIGYHGWADSVLTTPPAWGLPPATRISTDALPWGDLRAAELAFKGILHSEDAGHTPTKEPVAAVIVEPATLEKPPPGYLPGLRHLCQQHGALLVFDECITGGRYPLFTCGNTFGVLPDLTVLSKGLANGMPLGAVVGSAEVMACFEADFHPSWADTVPGLETARGPVYVSGTWSAPGLSLAAASATLRVWERDDVAARVWTTGTALRNALYAEADGGATMDGGARLRIRGQPYRWALETVTPTGEMDYVALTLLRQYLVDEGVLVGTGFNLSLAHCTDGVLGRTVEAWKRALAKWRTVAGGDEGRRAALTNGHVCLPAYRQA